MGRGRRGWCRAMRTRYFTSILLAAAASSSTSVAVSAPAPHEIVHRQFQRAITNLPGKSLTSVVVEYAPGAKSSAHHHAASAFIYAYVLSGSVRSQVGDEPAKVYLAGDDFYEAPGAYHRISENASTTEPARLLAVFVADTGQTLTLPDQD